MIRSLILSCALAMCGAPALGQTILVELFASQNCQACPKAHETMAALTEERQDVLVLTWSVDYWDYLGEADPHAMPQSSERQAAYVEHFGLRGPYTPQTVYNGRVECPGNRPGDVQRALGKVAGEETGVTVTKAPAGWWVSVPAGLDGEVSLVRFLPDGAHETEMVNPVVDVEHLTHFPRGGLLAFQPECETGGCAVMVQAPGFGPVYAAVLLD